MLAFALLLLSLANATLTLQNRAGFLTSHFRQPFELAPALIVFAGWRLAFRYRLAVR